MDCVRTSVRQGAAEVTLVYRRDMKDMPAVERGPRGDRGRRHHDLPGRPDPRPRRRGDRQGLRRRVHPDAARRARRVRPPAPRAGGRHRVRHRVRPGPPRHRPGAGPRPGSGPATRGRRRRSSAASRWTRSPSRPGRPGVFGTGDVRTGAATVVQAIADGRRAAYAVDAFLQGLDLAAIRTRQTLAEPQPEFLSIVPFTSEVKESAAPPRQHAGRGAARLVRRVRDPVQPRGGGRREHPLPPVHLRGDRLLRPAPPGHRVRDDPADAGAAEQPRGRLPQRHREPLHRHQPRLPPRRQPRLHPARAVALHRLRPLRQRLRGGGGRRLLRLHADRLRHAGDDAARHEPQRHALRLLRPLRRDVPHGRPHAQAADPREVRGRREPLHPVRHLRGRLPLRRAPLRPRLRAGPHEPRGADDRPHRDRRRGPRDGDDLRPARARLGRAGPRLGARHRAADAARPPGVASRAATGTARGGGQRPWAGRRRRTTPRTAPSAHGTD